MLDIIKSARFETVSLLVAWVDGQSPGYQW